MAASSVPSRSTFFSCAVTSALNLLLRRRHLRSTFFFSGAVTSALNLLLWRRHLRAPPSSPTLRRSLCKLKLSRRDLILYCIENGL
ncbi:hypothetical protein ACFX19_017362 [Malus domestica]